MALDNHFGAFAVYLCFLYASLNNVIKTDYESVMFLKGCKTIMVMLLYHVFTFMK